MDVVTEYLKRAFLEGISIRANDERRTNQDGQNDGRYQALRDLHFEHNEGF